ncbi:glutamate ABC transporter substrate-binding protein [Nocardioides salsibiostraticola]
MRFTRSKTAAAVAALALTLAACGSDGGDTEVEVADSPEFEAGTTMATLSEAGEIRVGTKFDQPGFGLLGLDDTPEGFDVEVAKIIAGALGIDDSGITYTESTSDIREQVIEDATVDMVVATYTINDERADRITFAGPYYTAGQQLMVAKDDDSVSSPEDLNDASIKVCSVTGSTPSEQIKEFLADPNQLVLFDTYDKCADSLANGQVQVVTTDNVILLGFVAASPDDFKLVGEQFTDEPYGIGIAKGDVAFCEFINETLAENEDAYVAAWEATAGQNEGTETPTLPEPNECK